MFALLACCRPIFLYNYDRPAYNRCGHYIKIFSISLDNAKKSFYRAFNALFSNVGRVASENVDVELLKTKCFPILLLWYGSVSAYKDTNKFAKLCHL